jgi:cobalamin biosynthesis Mg chelatase CobN
VLLRGSDVVIKDLNSTNGTFINGEQITESVLKPGQTLRLGQIELKLDTGTPGSAPASAPATAPASSPAKKQAEATMVVPRGVSLSELEGVGRPPGFDTSKEFSKKRNRSGVIFWIGVGIVVIIIVVLLFMAVIAVKGN